MCRRPGIKTRQRCRRGTTQSSTRTGNRLSETTGSFWRPSLRNLVHKYESGRAAPWRIEDQPADFHERMLANIVGFEMPVLKIEAQFKLGQNRRLEDRVGTVEGLETEASTEGRALAAFMRARQ